MQQGYSIESLVLDEAARREAFPVCTSKIFLGHAGVTALPKAVAAGSRNGDTHTRVRHDRIDDSGVVTLRAVSYTHLTLPTKRIV